MWTFRAEKQQIPKVDTWILEVSLSNATHFSTMLLVLGLQCILFLLPQVTGELRTIFPFFYLSFAHNIILLVIHAGIVKA